jgi:hypothetical protein
LKIGDHIQLSAKTQFTVRRPPQHWPAWAWALLAILGLGATVAVGWFIWL